MNQIMNDIFGAVTDQAQEKLIGIIVDTKACNEISRAIEAYLQKKSVIEEWAALEDAEHFRCQILFTKIQKNWKRDILPLYSEPDADRAEILRKEAIQGYKQLAGCQAGALERQLEKLMDDLLQLIDGQIKGHMASNIRARNEEQQQGRIRKKLEEEEGIPARVSELERQQERLASKWDGDSSALVYFEHPAVDSAIDRPELRRRFSEHLQSYRVLQILGPSASGKSTFAKQFVNAYHVSHEIGAVYVECTEGGRFDEIRKLISENESKWELVVVDFVKGKVPERWREDFICYLETAACAHGLKWMLFAQEAVFPELEQAEYSYYGIHNKLHMVGVSFQEWEALAEAYSGGRMERNMLQKAYRKLSAGKSSGIYIKMARLFVSLPEDTMWEAIEKQQQNITDCWESRQFEEVCQQYDETALLACLLEPFSVEWLEEIEPQGHWKMIIQTLHQKGILLLYDDGKYTVHETTRINMEQSISRACLVRWHGRLADLCREEELFVECIMHLQRAGRMDEADELARSLFAQGRYAGQILGYVRHRSLFSTDELLEFLQRGKTCYEAYILLKDRNDPALAKDLLAVLGQRWETENYQAPQRVAGLILDCLPERWFEVLRIGCRQEGKDFDLLSGICLACRGRRLSLDHRICQLIQSTYRSGREDTCLQLCYFVFEQRYYPAYQVAWEYVVKGGVRDRGWSNSRIRISLQEPEALPEVLRMFEVREDIVTKGCFFDEMTMRFVLEHQLELQPYCLQVLEDAADGDVQSDEKKDAADGMRQSDERIAPVDERLLRNAVLVLLCYHHPKGRAQMKELFQQGKGKGFWRRIADCSWNVENWRMDFSMQALLDEGIEKNVLRLLQSKQRQEQQIAVSLLVNKILPETKPYLLNLLRELPQEDPLRPFLVCAAVENGASAEDLREISTDGEPLGLWQVILMGREGDQDAVPELMGIVQNEGESWQLRREAVRALAELDGDALRELAPQILWGCPTTEFDDTMDLEGHGVFGNMLSQGICICFNEKRDGNLKFLAECYRMARGKEWMTEDKAMEHARWLYESLEKAGGVKDGNAIAAVLSKLYYPLVQDAVLRGLRAAGERELLEEVIAKGNHCWIVLRALIEWCKMREADWEVPQHSFGQWELFDRMVQRMPAGEMRDRKVRMRGGEYSPITLVGYDEAMEMLRHQKPFPQSSYLDYQNMTGEQREELQGQIRQLRQSTKDQGGEMACQRQDVMQLDGTGYYMQQHLTYRSGQESGFIQSLSHLDWQGDDAGGRGDWHSGQDAIIHACVSRDKQKVLDMLMQDRRLWYRELLDVKVRYALRYVADEDFVPLLADWSVLGCGHLEVVCHLMQNITQAAYDNFFLRLLHRVLGGIAKLVRDEGGRGGSVELNRSLRYLLEHPRFGEIRGARECVLQYAVPLKDSLVARDILETVRDMPEAFVALYIIRYQDRELRHYWHDTVEVCTEALRNHCFSL